MYKNCYLKNIFLIFILLFLAGCSSLKKVDISYKKYPNGLFKKPKILYRVGAYLNWLPYSASELVLIPTGFYKEKYFDGKLEVVKKLKNSLYLVKPYISFTQQIKDWYNSWYYDNGYADPLCYLYVPFKTPNLVGKELISDKITPINIFYIKNMTDEKYFIKDRKLRSITPEYWLFFKAYGAINVDGTIYPKDLAMKKG